MSKCSDTDDKAWGLSKYKYVSIKSYIAVENSRGVRVLKDRNEEDCSLRDGSCDLDNNFREDFDDHPAKERCILSNCCLFANQRKGITNHLLIHSHTTKSCGICFAFPTNSTIRLSFFDLSIYIAKLSSPIRDKHADTLNQVICLIYFNCIQMNIGIVRTNLTQIL